MEQPDDVNINECNIVDLLPTLFRLQSQRCLTYQRLSDAQAMFLNTRNFPAFQTFLSDITLIFARISEEILRIKKRFETKKLIYKHIEQLQDYEQKKLQLTNDTFVAHVEKKTEEAEQMNEKLLDLVENINEILEELRYDQEDFIDQIPRQQQPPIMSAITTLNPKAESARQAQALAINISAARGLAEILKTNLGPKGTMKMLVSGAGEIKITKDGNTLLHEMQVQHPTASLIARAATAQDDITGDGTTSIVLLIGELLKQADLYISEGLHPRIVAEGFELAKKEALQILDKVKVPIGQDRETLIQVARTSLRTKLTLENADTLTDIVVDAVLALNEPGKPIDLNMVEIMEMQHRTEGDSRLVRGVVLDHGGRHPSMPKALKNAYILTCNISLEYEKTEVNAGFFYKNAEERDRLVTSERKFIDDRVLKIVELKRKVCSGDDKNKSFVVINQKGIDPFSLDVLAKEGILGLRRAKRRNMERLTLACGGEAMNSVEDLTKECLGYAEDVYEHVLGEEKFTFIEGCKNPKSVTVLLKGSTKYILNQLKDALRDGLRSLTNAIEDGCVIPGGGAFEIVAHHALTQYKEQVKGRARLGVQAFAEALLIIPKAIAQNAGHDQQESIVKLQQEYATSKIPVGIDVTTGEAMEPKSQGIYDNFRVKKQLIHSSTSIASNLILVDEILRAGLSSLRPGGQ